MHRNSNDREHDSDKGRGWYGDRKSHAKAALWGCYSRDETDHSARSEGRGRSGSDRGQSGWIKDPEGYRVAARRGWRNR